MFCNVPGIILSWQVRFCGIGEPECALNVGVSGPGVVRAAVEALPDNANMSELANKIKEIAYKNHIHRRTCRKKISKTFRHPVRCNRFITGTDTGSR